MIRIGTVTLVWFVCALGLQSEARADHMELGPQDKLILGWIEKIVLKPGDLVLRAKLDTGANTASIDAEKITYFTRDNQPWVRFVYVKNKRNSRPDQPVEFERPLVRTEQIKEHFGVPQERPVVTLHFCLHGTLFETEFNLVDRTNFKYPILLGRRFLQKIALVDPESTQLIDIIQRDCDASGMDAAVKEVDADYEFQDVPAIPESTSESESETESEADKSDEWDVEPQTDQDPDGLPAQPIAQSTGTGPAAIEMDTPDILPRIQSSETNGPGAAQGDTRPKLKVALQAGEK